MGGHLTLPGKCHLSPVSFGGTFDIVQSTSNVPESFRRLGPYGGTFDIVREMSNVPESFRRLGPYGGTFDIAWEMSFGLLMSFDIDI